jgi:hypothetical protein
MPIIYAVVVAAILAAATWFFAGDFIPDAGMVYFQGTGEMQDCQLTRLHMASVLAGFLGWSIGLYMGARR